MPDDADDCGTEAEEMLSDEKARTAMEKSTQQGKEFLQRKTPKDAAEHMKCRSANNKTMQLKMLQRI